MINRKRRRKMGINREIGFEEWDECFRELLGSRVKLELRGKGRIEVKKERRKGMRRKK